LWIGSVISVLVVTAVVVVLLSKDKPDSGEVVIKVADTSTSPNSWDLVTWLTGRDILKEEGVKLQRVPGISGVSTGPRFLALSTGALDVEYANWVSWVAVIARGEKIKAVYGQGATTKAFGQLKKSGILVLENSSIHSIKDLKGKTIAVNTLGLDAEYTIKLLLQKNGFSLADVQLLVVPDANEEQVLRTKQVDAATGTTTGGTWFDLALDRGGIRIIPGTNHYEVIGRDTTNGGVGFREDFIKAHPDAVRRYVTAVEKAKRIIWDAYQKDPERVRKIHAEITKEKGGNTQLTKFYYLLPPDATLTKDSDIQFWIDVLVAEGQLKPGQIKPSDIYTNEFNPFAVSQGTVVRK
jgi:ABC-type nitrate/sulfonate/bicarbonate transport system substrate-binding protein